MDIKLSTFKELLKQYNKVASSVNEATLVINTSYGSYPKYEETGQLAFKYITFKSVGKMYSFSKQLDISTYGLTRLHFLGEDFCFNFENATRDETRMLAYISSAHVKEFKSIKLAPTLIPNDYQPWIIQNSPLEATEGNYTYRFLTGLDASYSNCVKLISRNDDNLYDYLDKGFFLMEIPNPGKQKQFIVANEYDVNVAHIFAMCKLQPALTELLQKGCFVNVHSAEMIRLRMHKKLADKHKKVYAGVAELIDNDYKSNTTLIVVGKLLSGEVEKTTVNNVIFTTTTAKYEQISIEAADLLPVLYSKLNFNGEFDVYGLVSIYANKVEAGLDKLASEQSKDKTNAVNKAEEGAGLNLDEHVAQLEDEEAVVDKKSLPAFKINDIEITAAISATGQRYINDVRVNKDEIAQGIHRASCHHGADDYKLFLKSISRMSIKWHDIIANGLQLKIHENMTGEELRDPDPRPTAPALKFIIDKEDKQIKLQVGKDKTVRVQLSRLVQRAATINKRTDGKSHYPKDGQLGYYRRTTIRNHNWAAEEIALALIDCCTFKKKVKNEEGKVEEVSEVLITTADIVALLNVVNEQKRLAIARSKEFLDTAVKLTNAVLIEFMGKPAYKVKGSLREYAVVIKDAKVYDYDSKQYRCIVNDRHYTGAGYDDIAARLLALKNDSMMQQQINTLKGAAQPQHEHVHNDQIPDRGVEDKITELVTKVLEKKA
jgi:hypothetical protein